MVELSRENGGLRLRVADDGIGIGIGKFPGHGGGLQGMRERALLVGGHLSVGEGERGTEVSLHVPNAGGGA